MSLPNHKRNNTITLFGYIAVLAAPLWGLTGIGIAMWLICKGARVRQAVGLLLTGLLDYFFTLYFFHPFDMLGSICVPLILTTPVAIIVYLCTLEKKERVYGFGRN